VKPLSVLVTSDAESDLADARDHYRAIDPVLESGFRREVERCIAAISRMPESRPMVYKSLRRAGLRRFPYFIIYAVFEDTLVVFGCIHARRDPTVWQSRVADELRPASDGAPGEFKAV
jgi:plasmid stabilization system protein ParE